MKEIKKYAWYFPNWHQTELNDKWHGKGWTEWQCVKYATPRFEGHLQPKVPLWGYEDESDPKVFEKKIDTALQYGLDGFIFDFYWFKDLGQYRIDALNKGFLGAKNNEKCEFAIMWCNHDPIYVHPCSYKKENVALASGDADESFMNELTEYCIKNYFGRSNYIKIDGKVWFGIWDTGKFIRNFGSVEKASEVLKNFRSRAREEGFELHIAAHKILVPGFTQREPESLEIVKKLGLDSLFSYNWVRPQVKVWPQADYEECIELNRKIMKEDLEFSDVPVDMTVALGWDISPRTVQSDMYENIGYPFSEILVNNTPDNIEKAYRCTKEISEREDFKGNMVTFSCWNEWTEGAYLEPDTTYGYEYLERLKKVFKGEKND